MVFGKPWCPCNQDLTPTFVIFLLLLSTPVLRLLYSGLYPLRRSTKVSKGYQKGVFGKKGYQKGIERVLEKVSKNQRVLKRYQKDIAVNEGYQKGIKKVSTSVVFLVPF